MQRGQEEAQIGDLNTNRASNWTATDPLDLPLAGADIACKECSRRKVKCNRAVPTCGLCLKYRRHCLYEKHSRTPLTRKHLTEVEERLERAERLLRQARLKNLLPPNIGDTLPELGRPGQSTSQDNVRGSPDASNSAPASQRRESDFNAFNQGSQPLAAGESFAIRASLDEFPNHEPLKQAVFFLAGDESRSGLGGQDSLTALEDQSYPYDTFDGPPVEADNFEWDEQHVSAAEAPESGQFVDNSIVSEGDEAESAVTDGMASLTMSENESGYLGVASGAALLKIIDPSTLEYSTQRSKSTRLRLARISSGAKTRPVLLYEQPNPNRHIASTVIDAYFRHFNTSYPIVHEPTFRAQYSEVIERPNGDCWKVLAYVIAAVGVFSTATGAETLDLRFFAQAKTLMHCSYLESGNLTLVQALTLMSNYLQKRNKPNSGYNYLGLASRMAMGIGLHKEFQGWAIRPLKMEIRRRVWWCLCVFDIGATITFGRPIVWPGGGIDVALPMNVHDYELTAASQQYPTPAQEITTYTAVRSYASFYLATNPIYSRVISKPFPSAKELISLDDKLIGEWYSSLPPFFTEDAQISPEYRISHAIMMWKYRNLKIIMYRPFVIRQALYARQGYRDNSPEGFQAYDRCLHEARLTILSIEEFWNSQERTRMAAWYALYFLFQAALIPCICLRNEPASPNAGVWRQQIQSTLDTIVSISTINPSGERCREVILGLCGPYLLRNTSPSAVRDSNLGPINESPQTQMNTVYSMMWPNIPAAEADVFTQDDVLMDFFRGENQIFDESNG